VPWNPRHPFSSEEPWEQAVRLPGRIVSLPLLLLAQISERGLLSAEQRHLPARILHAEDALSRFGLHLLPASLGDRTGLGGKLRLAPPIWNRLLEGELSGSTRHYSSTRLQASQGPVWIVFGYDWRPEERFYGLTNESSEDDTTSFASQITSARAGVVYPFFREATASPLELNAWFGPQSLVLRDGRESGVTPLSVGFPWLAGSLGRAQDHLVFGLRLVADGRRGQPHWSQGGRIIAQVEQFTTPAKRLALRSASKQSGQFTRWEVRGEAGISFWPDPRTLRLSGRIVNQTIDTALVVLLPYLADLGGSHDLAGFEAGRFHDVDLAVGKLSYLFPLARHFEVDLHAEAGGVYPNLRRARPETLEQSYGVALRCRSGSAPLGSIGLDWSREAVRLRFSWGDVE
jgi:hypothetical protein